MEALRALLATMNRRPGAADPQNAILPFGEFEQLHFARFVILDDKTLADRDVHGVPLPNAPVYLAFLGDCDGPAGEMLSAFATRAGDGLRHDLRALRGVCRRTPTCSAGCRSMPSARRRNT